jgi:multiple sugar transport system substrate-binding protein
LARGSRGKATVQLEDAVDGRKSLDDSGTRDAIDALFTGRIGRRQFMVRAALLGLSGAAVSTILAACGTSTTSAAPSTGASAAQSNGASAAPSTGASAPQSNVEITFWDMPWGNDAYNTTAKQLVDQFNKSNAGFTVKYQQIGWDQQFQAFSTAIGAGQAPDLSTGPSYQGPQFAKEGAIAPLDDLVASWQQNGKAADFYAGALDGYKYQSHYVSVPWSMDIRVLWYRSDLLASAGIQTPTTWDEVRAAAKKLSGRGKYAMAFAGDPFGWQILLALMIGNGGGIFSTDGKVAIVTDRNREAGQHVQDLVRDGSISPAAVSMTSDDMFKAIGSGAAFGWDSAALNTNYTPDVNKNLLPLPSLKGPHGDQGTLHWLVPLMVYTQSKHLAESKQFISYWMDQMPTLLGPKLGAGLLPVQKTVAADADFQAATFQTVYTNWLPTAKYTSSLDPTMFPELGAVEGSSVLTTFVQDLIALKDLDATMQKAQSGLEQVLAAAQSM